ncbi:extracellular solute-binding protein [Streptomyces sp. NPDC059152]|uniref:extracellular solute-binding protein n=1 Tax=Streptomyces sp. NPDC059152 TaxID=3346742 RepID=UPI003675C6C6
MTAAVRRRVFLSRTAGMAGTAAFGLAGCGSGAASGGTVRLTVLAASYGRTVGSLIVDRWHEFIAAFEKEHRNIGIDLELAPIEKIDRTLAERVAAGREPDIAQSYTFADYAEAGRLYSADDLFDLSAQADFLTPFARAGELGFTEYGIPFLTSTPRLFYHTGHFARAGLSGPPTSWSELRTAAQALKAAGVTTPYGLQFGPEAAEDEALAWMLATGGGYGGQAGYDFPKDANVEALTWVKEQLVAPGLAGEDPARFSRTPAYAAFLKGEVGMMLAHPVLIKAADRAGVPYADAAFPMKDGGAAPPVGLSDWLMAFKRNGHRQECAAFLDFLYSERATTRFAQGQGTLPVTVSGSEALRAQRSARALWPFIDQMPRAEFHPVGRSTWPKVRDTLRQRIRAAVGPGGDPRALLKRLQKAAEAAEAARPAAAQPEDVAP